MQPPHIHAPAAEHSIMVQSRGVTVPMAQWVSLVCHKHIGLVFVASKCSFQGICLHWNDMVPWHTLAGCAVLCLYPSRAAPSPAFCPIMVSLHCSVDLTCVGMIVTLVETPPNKARQASTTSRPIPWHLVVSSMQHVRLCSTASFLLVGEGTSGCDAHTSLVAWTLCSKP